jgi:hypothetical protein
MGFFQKAYPAVRVLFGMLEKFEKIGYKENLSMGVGK